MCDFAYIMSPSYSGSTLLTFLLATHPGVATVGELKATAMGDVEAYHCSCGALIRQCPFWSRVRDELARRGVDFNVADFGTHFQFNSNHGITHRLLQTRVRGCVFELARDIMLRLQPGCNQALEAILKKNCLLVEVIREIQGARLFLDGSKDPVRLKYLAASRQWKIKVIYLIRDGRGACNSYMKHYKLSMDVAALEWRRTHKECDLMVSRLPNGSWVKVHYEDLCRKPDATLKALFGFLGLDSGLASRDYRPIDHHILGNVMRLRASSEVTLDEKWKHALTPSDLATFERVAGDLNRHYGYAQPSMAAE